MTNAELIAKIKAEIERLYNYEKEMFCDIRPDNDGWAESLAIMGVLEELLSFLGTLENSASEKPNNHLEVVNDLTSEVQTRAVQLPDGRYVTEELSRQMAHEGLDEAAENIYKTPFGTRAEDFKAGAEWQAEQLLSGRPLPEDTVLFNKGVEEGKRLMMEEAVEGEVMTNGFYPYEPRIVAPYPNCPYDFGDKVRVIVLPKED